MAKGELSLETGGDAAPTAGIRSETVTRLDRRKPVADARPAGSETATTPAPTTAPPKGGRKRRVLLVIGLLALAGVGWKGWDWWTHGRFVVSTDDAYVKAETAIVAARTGGTIVATPFADGARVKAGDVLVEIDPVDTRLAVASAEARIATQTATIGRIAAQIAAAKAQIAQAEAQLVAARAAADNAEVEFDRATQLVAAAAGTRQKVDATRSARDQAKAAVAAAEAGVAAARGAAAVYEAQKTEAERQAGELAVTLDKAQREASFTRVIAPFDGVVGNRAAQVGALVQPGTRLLALVPLDRVYVEANFKETQLARIRPGQPATIEVDALGGATVEGRVVGVSPATGAQFSLLPPENATGNFTKIVQRVPVRIEVSGEAVTKGLLRAGLSVVADVDVREATKDARP
jgi:membrane fusion protein (multidrug efflux system)